VKDDDIEVKDEQVSVAGAQRERGGGRERYLLDTTDDQWLWTV